MPENQSETMPSPRRPDAWRMWCWRVTLLELPHPLSQRDRTFLLRRLRFRYEQMRTQSLQDVVQMELGLAERPAAVHNAASLSLRLPDQPDGPLPTHTSIIQAYDQAQQDLLILGEPGAGKSTLLLELAYALVEQAEQDAILPLPVVLPLSSWALSQRPLADWLVEQFTQLYDVPRNVSLHWIATGMVLPLLDGLDEMDSAARPACISAINLYHRRHLGPLVICSRTNEYETAATHEKLSLHTAVVVQPLRPADVDTYLGTLGTPLAALRAALHKNSALHEIATTPLMLQVLMLTYHGTTIRELSRKELPLQKQIWADYVERMVNRKGDAMRYPPNVTCAWLGWLARQMRRRNQSIFFLEQLQPDWLPKRRKATYLWSVVLVIVLISGLVSGLICGLLAGLSGGLSGGLLVGLSFGGYAGGFVGMKIKITPLEALTWSWKGLRSGLLGGLLCGLLGWLSGRVASELFGGLLGGLLCGLLGGLSWGQLTERHMLSPNEGIRRSITNGLVCGLLGGLLFGLVSGLVFEPLGWLLGGWPSMLAFGLLGGLGATLQHYTLRFWLWRFHCFPVRTVPFLEDATARILLRRVGGGYRFSHGLLLDYFADLQHD